MNGFQGGYRFANLRKKTKTLKLLLSKRTEFFDVAFSPDDVDSVVYGVGVRLL